jgi:hypothetical protein
MKSEKQYHIKKPNGQVDIVGESEIMGIKQKIELGYNFEILGEIAVPTGTAAASVGLPANKEKNPLECLTCGHVAKTPDALYKHLEDHQSAGSSTSATSSTAKSTSPKSTSRKASKKSGSK